MRSKIIHVTAADIKNGNQIDASGCAIAKAIMRELGIESGVLVGPWSLSIDHPKHAEYKLNINRRATEFITKFDNDKSKAKPFSFALKGIPAED